MPIDLVSVLSSLGIALGLGLLVGLQREQVATELAGLRTFALITILGTICGLLALQFGGWVIAAGFLALTGVIMIGHLAELNSGKFESGVTTEAAALAMFGLGAYLVIGYREAAIVIGGGIAVLLHFKGELHGIATRLGPDSKAIMQFALISLVILPVLPDRTYGPYQVLNPRQIWLMVVLIVGIGLGGYIVYKFCGERVGLLAAGVLGGIVSSTATTVGYARRAARDVTTERPAAIVILLASTVSSALALVEIGIVAPRFLPSAFAPLAALVATLGLFSLGYWFWRRKEPAQSPTLSNPSELRGALYFAAIYSVILLAIAAVKDQPTTRGLYTVAALSGLAEVHALTLSTSQLVEAGRMASQEGWRVILVALLSNLAAKAGAAALIGGFRLARKIALPFLTAAAIGTGLLILG